MNPFCDLFWKYFESVGLIISNSFCNLICKLVISLLNPIFHLICNLFWKNFEFVGLIILNPFCDLLWKNFEFKVLLISDSFCYLFCKLIISLLNLIFNSRDYNSISSQSQSCEIVQNPNLFKP